MSEELKKRTKKFALDVIKLCSGPSHLFISYAVEEAVLARWLARELAVHGQFTPDLTRS